MKLDVTMNLRDLVVAMPGATEVFEGLGLDYCCHGGRSLLEACTAAKVSVDSVVRMLDGVEEVSAEVAPRTDWSREPLENLIRHIVDRHHTYTRQAMERVQTLLPKVVRMHGAAHAELATLHDAFDALRADLTPHMAKEEQVLFPYIVQLERASAAHQPPPGPFFGTVRHPIRVMMQEHDVAGDLLRRMREIAGNYVLPDEACTSWEQVYQALPALERDLHQHIHLENNVLFPRAVTLEDAAMISSTKRS
jgi:regulator of cell morphogenesis and NO signaling